MADSNSVAGSSSVADSGRVAGSSSVADSSSVAGPSSVADSSSVGLEEYSFWPNWAPVFKKCLLWD